MRSRRDKTHASVIYVEGTAQTLRDESEPFQCVREKLYEDCSGIDWKL